MKDDFEISNAINQKIMKLIIKIIFKKSCVSIIKIGILPYPTYLSTIIKKQKIIFLNDKRKKNKEEEERENARAVGLI